MSAPLQIINSTTPKSNLSRETHHSMPMSDPASDMPGIKRHHDGAVKKEDGDGAQSPFMAMFEVFRDELDEHHDRRERIIKAGRDITAASKKIIFALQRVRSLKSPVPAKIASEVQEKMLAMQKQFESIAPDLTGINAWRYQRQISGGIQEYMEAVSFQHYLINQTLITLEEASRQLPDAVTLTGDDYVLGIFDLVGELMRFAITTIATTGALPGSKDEDAEQGERDILIDLRELRTSFQALDTTSCWGTGLGKDVQKKMEVMKTCVEKVETAVYGMIIRGRERPKGWIPDLMEDRGGVVESY
ncbi:translin-associated protein X [Drepanopeziza brunnea f. sp. 'multigermtubi' MB_m1]|uniref:Translin-associated protein X n=1 Tax=Marssonina brunnea f. sp. multigermtubi (strain MB_m1) TaxID=1072389 RepID=K1WKD6_MARBU|nr:translin-associated protein X [Drepanopeziza brunnea f. sp. 'multigermtubi' MB_m1]EKD12662.1 translin-associated protein X [Drepanopeziza brunnea f. sp. 'multigermtubi' MB_m1]